MIVVYNPRAGRSHRRLPLSALTLGAVLEGRYDYAIVDGNVEPDPLPRILALLGGPSKPRILAVTVMPGPQLLLAVEHTRAVRQAFADVVIVWGGYFPSDHPEVCLRAEYVDFVVRGNAEETLLELLATLEGTGSLCEVAGLSYVETSNAIGAARTGIRHNPARGIADPERLPPLPYARVPGDRYFPRTYLGDRTGNYHSSYGCPFTCNFCSVVVTYQARWKAQSPERVIEAAGELAQRFGIDALEFHDNNFFVHEARTRAIAIGLEPLGLSWWGEGRIDTLLKYDDATWKTMRRSGCRMIFTGAESGSDEKLALMNKGGTQTAADILEAARRFREHDIVPEFSFVLGQPPDAEADIRQNIEFIRKLKAVNPASEIILYLYTPVPLPGLYEQARAQGFAYPETLEEWVSSAWSGFSGRRDPRTPWIRPRDRRLLRDFETVLNARYPTATELNLGAAARRWTSRAAGLRWRNGWYDRPLELRALLRGLSYRQPEEEGFPVDRSAAGR